MPHRACPQAWAGGMGTTGPGEGEAGHGGAVSVLEWRADGFRTVGGFKPEVQHLPPIKVRRCHHLVRPRPINNFSLKSASPLPV